MAVDINLSSCPVGRAERVRKKSAKSTHMMGLFTRIYYVDQEGDFPLLCVLCYSLSPTYRALCTKILYIRGEYLEYAKRRWK